MLRYGITALLLTATIGAANAQSDAVRPERARPEAAVSAGVGPPDGRPHGVRNQVLDLLDGEFVLDSTSERTMWRSRAFDTSQFTRVGIRVTAQEDGDPVLCSLWWQFARDDAFLPGPPSAAPPLIGGPEPPPPTSAVLTDVKVLLRLE